MTADGPDPVGRHRTVRHLDGSGWQEAGGYSRAVRRAGLIAVSGTTANGPDGRALHPGDTYAQTRECLAQVLNAITQLGGRLEDVVRTRLLLAPGAVWQDATRAHGEVFAQIRPANSTYFVAGLVGDGFLVEVEAEALVDG
jgi:enamine deaminase RidA (YjgF/YER057c/UK114 family)